MKELVYTTDTPTEPGWYYVKYKGFKARREIETMYELAFPDPDDMLGRLAPGKLAIKTIEKFGVCFQELRFHPDCHPVKWAGPIPQPKEPR